MGQHLKVGVLVSGAGTNLQALLDRLHFKAIEVVAVASDQETAPALRRAQAVNVPTRVFPRSDYSHRVERDLAIADWLDLQETELLVLAGYMQLLSPEFLRRFLNRIINVHPSLLPAFPGLHAVEQAIAYGVTVFGVTVHLVDEGIDTGPIIKQRAIELEAPTYDSAIAALHQIEHDLLSEVVASIAKQTIDLEDCASRRPSIPDRT